MIGIAIASYNRAASLGRLLDSIAALTTVPHRLVVADDGSTDETVALCRTRGVTVVSGPNRGIAWNKNRGLYWLMTRTDCDTVLSMEDDLVVADRDWLPAWQRAIATFGHVTWANPKLVRQRADRLIGGRGTVADPYLMRIVTGQVMGFTRAAIARVGYFDTRFKGYGYEHIELSKRLHDAGYGFVDVSQPDGHTERGYVNIHAGIDATELPTISDRSTTEANRQVFERLKRDPRPQDPWQDDDERRALEAELDAAR